MSKLVRAFVACGLIAGALLAGPGTGTGATPAPFVATSDADYTRCGRVFSDPHAYWPSPAQAPGRSPWAKGNAPCAATDFLGYDDMIAGMGYLESLYPGYLDFVNLKRTYGDGTDCTSASSGSELCSAGLPALGVSGPERRRQNLYLIRVTDESVSNAAKKYFVFPLSIHGIERAGAEAGVRAAEDLATWASCEAGKQPSVVSCAKEGAIPHALMETTPANSVTAGDALKRSVLYFVFANPDGWSRGDIENGVRFYQRYNGNGVDMNRDWPSIGFTFAPYTPWSEPETRGFGQVLKSIKPQWDGGIDLHGQLIDRAFSFTLLGQGQHTYSKNQRILQTVKGAWQDAEARLKWSPLIKPNDAPKDDERVYGVQWGTVWDTINYTTTGAFGDWIDSPLGLNADGIDNEMSLSHIANCGVGSCWLPDVEQLHVDGNKSLVYAMVNFTLEPEDTTFSVPGKAGYVFSDRVASKAGSSTSTSRYRNLDPQPAITDARLDPTNGFKYRFEIQGPTCKEPGNSPCTGVYNGGVEGKATPVNVGAVSGFSLTKLTLERWRSGEEDGQDGGCGNADDDWEVVNEYYNQSSIYLQAGQAVHSNAPLPGLYRICLTGGLATQIASSGGFVDLDITFSKEKAWEDPGQVAYSATNMKFFDDLAKNVPGGLEKIDADKLLNGSAKLDGLSSLVIADDAFPGYNEAAATGPAQATETYAPPTKAATTVPCAYSPGTQDVLPPTCAGDYEFDVKPDFNNQRVTVTLTASPLDLGDWDLYVERQSRITGDWFPVGKSTTSTANERVTLLTPPIGHYRARVVNWAGTQPPEKLEIAFSNETVGSTPPSSRTQADVDKWGAALRTYVEQGGNLVLTDGAVRNLAYMNVLPRKFISTFSVYAGFVGFTRDGNADTYSDPLAKNVNQPGAAEGAQHRHQTYEPVPLGFAIQDASGADFNASPAWAVDQLEWEQAGGRTVGITTPDQVTLGELKLGAGTIRIVGALLPMPTQDYYHPFGLASYAVTYTGYQLLHNALQWERPAAPSGGGGGGGSTAEAPPAAATPPDPASPPAQEQPAAPAPPAEQPPAAQPALTAPPAPPAVQPPAPPSGGVAGATKTVTRSASGWGAIRSGKKLGYFWFRAGTRTARLKFDDKPAGVHVDVRNARIAFAQRSAVLRGITRVRGRAVRFVAVVVDRGARGDTFRITLGNGYGRSGTVVRGYLIVR